MAMIRFVRDINVQRFNRELNIKQGEEFRVKVQSMVPVQYDNTIVTIVYCYMPFERERKSLEGETLNGKYYDYILCQFVLNEDLEVIE